MQFKSRVTCTSEARDVVTVYDKKCRLFMIKRHALQFTQILQEMNEVIQIEFDKICHFKSSSEHKCLIANSMLKIFHCIEHGALCYSVQRLQKTNSIIYICFFCNIPFVVSSSIAIDPKAEEQNSIQN